MLMTQKQLNKRFLNLVIGNSRYCTYKTKEYKIDVSNTGSAKIYLLSPLVKYINALYQDKLIVKGKR